MERDGRQIIELFVKPLSTLRVTWLHNFRLKTVAQTYSVKKVFLEISKKFTGKNQLQSLF